MRAPFAVERQSFVSEVSRHAENATVRLSAPNGSMTGPVAPV